MDPLCACVDFPDREAESDVHSVYKEGENSYIHRKGLFQSPSVSHTLPLWNSKRNLMYTSEISSTCWNELIETVW